MTKQRLALVCEGRESDEGGVRHQTTEHFRSDTQLVEVAEGLEHDEVGVSGHQGAQLGLKCGDRLIAADASNRDQRLAQRSDRGGNPGPVVGRSVSGRIPSDGDGRLVHLLALIAIATANEAYRVGAKGVGGQNMCASRNIVLVDATNSQWLAQRQGIE